MLVYRKMENLTSFLLMYAQMTVPFTTLNFSFSRGDDYKGCSDAYSTHTNSSLGYSKLDYVTNLTIWHVLVLQLLRVPKG